MFWSRILRRLLQIYHNFLTYNLPQTHLLRTAQNNLHLWTLPFQVYQTIPLTTVDAFWDLKIGNLNFNRSSQTMFSIKEIKTKSYDLSLENVELILPL